jgi:hypothetical protein
MELFREPVIGTPYRPVRVEPPADLHFVDLDVADEPGRDEIDWG